LALLLLALTAQHARADLFVSSLGSSQVLEYNGTTGAFVTAFVPTNSGGLSAPTFLTFSPPPAVPEPTSLALLGLGTVALALWRRRRRTA